MDPNEPPSSASSDEASTIYDTDDVIAYIQARNQQAALAASEALEELELDEPVDSLAPAESRRRRHTLLGLDGYQWSVVLALVLAVMVLALALAVRLVVAALG